MAKKIWRMKVWKQGTDPNPFNTLLLNFTTKKVAEETMWTLRSKGFCVDLDWPVVNTTSVDDAIETVNTYFGE